MGKIQAMTGNTADYTGAALCRPDLIAAYPITPQSSVVEGLAGLVYNGRLDASFVQVESERSAMSVVQGVAERGAKMLYVCYDNEGYMNTGYQRSSTTSLGSSTSTTPAGAAINGKEQQQKYLPLIMAMHNIEYCATASPSNMADLVAKIQKGLDASKRGFAYLHVFSPCPTGWKFAPNMSIEVAKKAVASNMFPLCERSGGKFTLSRSPSPITVEEFIQGIGKFRKLTPEKVNAIQEMVDARYALLTKLAAE